MDVCIWIVGGIGQRLVVVGERVRVAEGGKASGEVDGATRRKACVRVCGQSERMF